MTIGGVEGDDDACRRACRGPAAARCDDGQRLQTNLKTFLSWFSFGSNSLEKPWGSPKDPSGRGNSGFEPSGISQVRVVRGPGDALFSRTLNRLSTAETFLVQNVEIGSSIVSVTSTENKTQAAQGTEQCAGRDTAAALDACLIAEKRGDAAAAACCCCSPLLLLLHSCCLLLLLLLLLLLVMVVVVVQLRQKTVARGCSASYSMGKKPPQRKVPARLPCIVHALCGSVITGDALPVSFLAPNCLNV